MQDDFRAPQRPVKPAPLLKTATPPKTDSQESAVSFKTPEQVSSIEAVAEPLLRPALAPTSNKPRGTGHHWFNMPWPPTKHEIILVATILLVTGLGGTGYVLLNKPAKPVKTAVATAKKAPVKAPAAPTTVPATLSGLPVSPAVNQRPVVGAMIENSYDARPQSGLSQAGVVFEAIAEGGITRFLALYQDQQPASIGPVRSARPYFVQWSLGFQAAYAHVGGSPDALSDIKAWNVQNIDQFANSSVFHRVGSRPAPHNMYASVVDLAALATQKGYKSQYTGFARKTASPLATPSASSIDMSISSSLYNVHYVYDAPSNTYLRSEGGTPHVDATTAKQLAPTVVIALVVPLSAGSKDAQGSAYSNYNPIGSGQAYVFQDGGVTVGTWHKASNTDQLSFTTADGTALPLNPGQTWITALASSSKVSYH